MKICPQCRETIIEFASNGCWCRACYNAYQRDYMQAWRKRHPDWIRIYSKRRILRRALRKVAA